jgi:hypothetical protein
MWLWVALACGGGKNTADTADSGFQESIFDTGAGDEEAVDTGVWSELMPTASWVSANPGYGTGGAFLDIDQDGDPDLVVAHGNDMSPGHLVVYKNVDGEFEAWPDWSSSEAEYYGHVSVGDLNGDSWPDVAVSRFLGQSGFEEPGGVQVFINREGLLDDTPSWEASGFFSFSCALGDMDQDGDLDLAVATGEAYYNEPGRSMVFENDGAGNFSDSPTWTTGSDRHSFDAVWADIDGDGWDDLVFANQGSGHTVYRNDAGMLEPTPWWEAGAEDGGYEGNTIDAGDVDGDGRVDLIISDNDQLGGVGSLRLWCGAELSVCWEAEQAYASAVRFFDWDGDGDIDLAAGGWWSPVVVFENDMGTLSMSPVWSSDKDDIVVEALDWADIDGRPGLELMVTDWTENAGNRIWTRSSE